MEAFLPDITLIITIICNSPYKCAWPLQESYQESLETELQYQEQLIYSAVVILPCNELVGVLKGMLMVFCLLANSCSLQCKAQSFVSFLLAIASLVSNKGLTILATGLPFG